MMPRAVLLAAAVVAISNAELVYKAAYGTGNMFKPSSCQPTFASDALTGHKTVVCTSSTSLETTSFAVNDPTCATPLASPAKTTLTVPKDYAAGSEGAGSPAYTVTCVAEESESILGYKITSSYLAAGFTCGMGSPVQCDYKVEAYTSLCTALPAASAPLKAMKHNGEGGVTLHTSADCSDTGTTSAWVLGCDSTEKTRSSDDACSTNYHEARALRRIDGAVLVYQEALPQGTSFKPAGCQPLYVSDAVTLHETFVCASSTSLVTSSFAAGDVTCATPRTSPPTTTLTVPHTHPAVGSAPAWTDSCVTEASAKILGYVVTKSYLASGGSTCASNQCDARIEPYTGACTPKQLKPSTNEIAYVTLNKARKQVIHTSTDCSDTGTEMSLVDSGTELGCSAAAKPFVSGHSTCSGNWHEHVSIIPSSFYPTTTTTTTTATPEPEDATANIVLEGDYDAVVGDKKAEFLKECTVEAKKVVDTVICSDVKKGSIIITFTGPPGSDVAKVTKDVAKGGEFKLPSFAALPVLEIDGVTLNTTTPGSATVDGVLSHCWPSAAIFAFIFCVTQS